MTLFDDAADELYGLAPGEFVAARTSAAAQARARGDAAAAGSIAKLRRPTVAAWLVNRLVRDADDLVEGALAIGPAMREATTSGDHAALRDLAGHRRRLVAELVVRARSIAAEVGQSVGDGTERDLETTFTAAIIDESAAEQVRGGRLTSALEASALGFGIGVAAPAAPPRPSTVRAGNDEADEEAAGVHLGSAAPDDEDEEADGIDPAVLEAEQALADARLQEADAAAALEEAQDALEDAVAREKAAAAAHNAAKEAVSDARADVTAAKADAAATSRAVAKALAALGRLHR